MINAKAIGPLNFTYECPISFAHLMVSQLATQFSACLGRSRHQYQTRSSSPQSMDGHWGVKGKLLLHLPPQGMF
jgi:hypothetical protein